MNKVCTKCLEERDITTFSKNKCKKDGLQNHCKYCYAQYRLDNKYGIKEYNKQYRLDNKVMIKEYFKQYQLDNKDKIKKQKKQYELINKEKLRETKRKYYKKRRQTDPIFNLIKRLRYRTWVILRRNNFQKSKHLYDYLGCTKEELRKHIESKFTESMTWAKVLSAEIEIDHIISLATAISEEDVYRLCHFSNLQPLWKTENRSKLDKVTLIEVLA